jgi:N-acetylglucosamine malate deacetylase 2
VVAALLPTLTPAANLMKKKKQKVNRVADAILLRKASQNHLVANLLKSITVKILYIFPHPDDESFGPAGAIHAQVTSGHEVHLLTLTRGGATNARHKLDLSIQEMGEVRYREMLDVKNALKLTSMTVLDFEDSLLKELDPRELEAEIYHQIQKIQPAIVVTYPVHGGSGFHDHLVTHAVVKRVYLEMKENGAGYLKRLAFFTMPDSGAPSLLPDGFPRLKLSEPALIDCIINLTDDDVTAMKSALNCYVTYQEMVANMGVVEKIGNKVHFEIAFETHPDKLSDLTARLN